MSKLTNLYAAGRRDPDAQLMINAVCAQYETNLVDLAERHPDVLDDLIEAVAVHPDLDQL